MRSPKPISTKVYAHPPPTNASELYLDLLKRSLCRVLTANEISRHTIDPGRKWLRVLSKFIKKCLSLFGLELVRLVRSNPEDYLESGDAAHNRAEDAETMVGMRQLDQMQACVNDIIDRSVPGDLLEAGVWRGGLPILMQAVLRTRNETHRKVWLADSFAGLPTPNTHVDSKWWRAGDMCASLVEVKDNFSRYGLLDDNVRFLKGFYNETLPNAPIGKLAVLRLDADLYESTESALEYLYPKLVFGGYAIFDDYQNLPECRRAIDEYRAAHSIQDPIVPIDSRAIYWIKKSGNRM